MRRVPLAAVSALLALAVLAPAVAVPDAAPGVSLLSLAASGSEAAAWQARVERAVTEGTLRLVSAEADADLPGRWHRRYDQRLGGVPVFGGQVAVQGDADGRALTVFGRLAEGLEAPPPPVVSATVAAEAAARAVSASARTVGTPELVLLPLGPRPGPAWMVLVRDGLPILRRTFVSAADGSLLLCYDDLRTEAAVGLGRGVFGDLKKMATERVAGGYEATDRLRPPLVRTFDFRFDIQGALRFYETGELPAGRVARDEDNDWADGAVVDAHVHAGLTYDYYYKRHGRRGIDDHDLPLVSLTHILPPQVAYANAFWDTATASMTYGDGDSEYAAFSAGLDVVAHELTHGVTERTWNGVYLGESGALNESFSDVVGTSVEFFFQEPGQGRGRADYFLGEDLSRVFDPARYAVRSMADPGSVCGRLGCHPDHVSLLYRGSEDGGGVHVNSGVANHAFYLAVEGGTNRTSGRRVAGLGATRRDRVERVFYRGFVRHLTPLAGFAEARAATVQAARDLYGAGGEEEAAVAAAWSAVGVE